jgi:hypothetical protein
MCPERHFSNLLVGINGMSSNNFLAKAADMILTPITGL